jgi:hypothetical protein
MTQPTNHPPTTTTMKTKLILTAACALASLTSINAAAPAVTPPPNAPAAVKWDAASGKLTLNYHGGVILDATVRAEDAAGKPVAGASIRLEQPPAAGEKDKVEQRLKFVLAEQKEGVGLALRGAVAGSAEAFAAETQGEAQKRFPVLRTSVGPSRSLRNNAIYDRNWDWMIAGPADGATRIAPAASDNSRTSFRLEARGPSLELVFRPRFYQIHMGQGQFEPWTYRIWKEPVVGYCSWWPYRDNISQQVVDALTEVFAAKKLPDFGYTYLQLDAGYAPGGGGPKSFLEWNKDKFPAGADGAIKRIRAAGMKPGIWCHRVYRSYVDRYLPDIGKQHPDWFVTKEDGSIYQGGYGIWTLNTASKEALDTMVRPLFRELKQQQWDYVKIDGAGDMLYSDKQEPAAAHFKKIGMTPEESLRAWDRVAREELGRETFILTCWGVGPGRVSTGIVDGVRLGSDGFQWNTMLGESIMNGVAWRGDPDHCDILPEHKGERPKMKTFGVGDAFTDTIIRPAVVSMAGSMLLVSDKAEVYKEDANLEGMKRSAPVLFTLPGQLYNGGGDGTWWLQEIERPFDHWSVLARFDWKAEGKPEQEVPFADLGLDADREYLVFEYWSQRFLGKLKGSFKAPAQQPGNQLQVFAIREAREHPWVLSTTRHISQGGVELAAEKWDKASNTLTGTSAVIAGDPYVLTVHLPAGFKLKAAAATGETAEVANQRETATVRIVPSATKTVQWSIRFELSGR